MKQPTYQHSIPGYPICCHGYILYTIYIPFHFLISTLWRLSGVQSENNESYTKALGRNFQMSVFGRNLLFITHQNLSMKQGCLFVCFVLFCFVLFCTYEIHRTRMLQMAFLVSLEKLLRRRRRRRRRGALAWFHGVWTCSARVLEY